MSRHLTTFMNRTLFAALCMGACVVVGATTPVSQAPGAAQYAWKGVDRVVAVGDVHGAYSRLETLLKSAGLIKNPRDGVRLLAKGELKAKVKVAVAGASKAAVEAVEALEAIGERQRGPLEPRGAAGGVGLHGPVRRARRCTGRRRRPAHGALRTPVA